MDEVPAVESSKDLELKEGEEEEEEAEDEKWWCLLQRKTDEKEEDSGWGMMHRFRYSNIQDNY